jgi:hypothetical protein
MTCWLSVMDFWLEEETLFDYLLDKDGIIVIAGIQSLR